MSSFKNIIYMLEKKLQYKVPLIGFLNSLLVCFLDNYSFMYPNLISDIKENVATKNWLEE